MSLNWRLVLRLAWIVLLLASTALLVWLWIASYSHNPKQLYHSTNRFCSWIGLKDGRFMYHFDGGPDVRTFAPRNVRLLGVFVHSNPNMGWQVFEAGIHAAHACVMLGSAWVLTIWFVYLRPRVRRRRGRCQRCGYLLAGLISDRCPECGTPVPRQAAPAR